MANAVPLSTWDADDETNDGLGVADENQAPSTVNDGMRKMMGPTRLFFETLEFRDFGDVPTRTSNTTFTVPGDQTLIYQIGRRLKAIDVSDLFGTITNSVFTTLTTVTVTLDSGNLSVSLTAVELGMAVDQRSIGTGALTLDSIGGLTQPRNLIIQNNSGNPNTQFDITATEVEVTDDTNKINLKSVSENVDITVNGAGGKEEIETLTGTYSTVTTAVTGSGTAFDTEFAVGDVLRSDTESESRRITNIASAIAMTLESGFSTDVSAGETVKRGGEAPNTFYAVYIIHDSALTLTDTLLSTNFTTPNNLPSGFTFKRLVGAVRNDSSSDFLGLVQFGDKVYYNEDSFDLEVLDVTAGSIATVFTDVDCSPLIPTIGRIGFVDANFRWDLNASGANAQLATRLNGSSVANGKIICDIQLASVDALRTVNSYEQLMDVSQIFEYRIVESSPGVGDRRVKLSIAGFILPL